MPAAAAGFPDHNSSNEEHASVLAQMFLRLADLIVQVRSLGANPEAGRADLPLLRAGQIVIGFGEPLTSPARVRRTGRREASAFSPWN